MTGVLGALAALLVTTGCATVTPEVGLPRAPLAQQALEAYLQQAQSESQQGLNDKSRLTLREAAMAYPAAKEPWLRLAEDYFRQTDYGNAILAAQEVVQRDAKNPIAQSVLAVSGLRVSAQALGELRDRSRFEVGSKGEAVELTRQMRVHLGESVLVPLKATTDAEPDAKASAPTPAAARPRPAPPAPRNATAQAPRNPPSAADQTGAVKPVVSTPSPTPPASARTPPPAAPKPAAPRNNPFTVLN